MGRRPASACHRPASLGTRAARSAAAGDVWGTHASVRVARSPPYAAGRYTATRHVHGRRSMRRAAGLHPRPRRHHARARRSGGRGQRRGQVRGLGVALPRDRVRSGHGDGGGRQSGRGARHAGRPKRRVHARPAWPSAHRAGEYDPGSRFARRASWSRLMGRPGFASRSGGRRGPGPGITPSFCSCRRNRRPAGALRPACASAWSSSFAFRAGACAGSDSDSFVFTGTTGSRSSS